MSRRFDFLNLAFNNAGVRYAVLKGLSLVPEFCPYAPLRHQGDFDYLVDPNSLEAAQRILAEAGYVPKPSQRARSRSLSTSSREPQRHLGAPNSTLPGRPTPLSCTSIFGTKISTGCLRYQIYSPSSEPDFTNGMDPNSPL